MPANTPSWKCRRRCRWTLLAFVEGAEKANVHCMMLENCCYGEEELLALT
jgi:hypothetical protein